MIKSTEPDLLKMTWYRAENSSEPMSRRPKRTTRTVRLRDKAQPNFRHDSCQAQLVKTYFTMFSVSLVPVRNKKENKKNPASRQNPLSFVVQTI